MSDLVDDSFYRTVGESIRKYKAWSSQQGEKGVFSYPDSATEMQVKTYLLSKAIERAEAIVGPPPNSLVPQTLGDRVRHVLKYARAHHVPPHIYRICWSVDQTLRKRHISNQDAQTTDNVEVSP